MPLIHPEGPSLPWRMCSLNQAPGKVGVNWEGLGGWTQDSGAIQSRAEGRAFKIQCLLLGNICRKLNDSEEPLKSRIQTF